MQLRSHFVDRKRRYFPLGFSGIIPKVFSLVSHPLSTVPDLRSFRGSKGGRTGQMKEVDDALHRLSNALGAEIVESYVEMLD